MAHRLIALLSAGIMVSGLIAGRTALAAVDSVPTMETDVVVSTNDLPIEGLSSRPAIWPMAVHLPKGVPVPRLAVSGDSVNVQFAEDIVVVLDEAKLTGLFTEFKGLFCESPQISTIRLTCNGQLLSSYLAPSVSYGSPPKPITRTIAAEGKRFAAIQGLSGRDITFGPSHGRYWEGTTWNWQRSDPCGLGEAVLEDTNSIRLAQYLYQYLVQDGATVHVPRQLDEGDCCQYPTTLSWWKMAAKYWLQHTGLPSWIWDASDTDYSDDIRARPLYADFCGSDIYLAAHTNAGGGGAMTGTETWRDTTMDHSEHVANSLLLAQAIQNNVVATIRELYVSDWVDRGVKNSNGGFGEIRIPNRPACLIELAFHDNCSRDAPFLTDNYFRSVAEWGVYKGMCEYFGTTPTWDRYSCELVSDTIPAEMVVGRSYNVSLAFRNRGVLWLTARGFRLRAVDDSDPFTSQNRLDIPDPIRPGQIHTFTLSMTAPLTAGLYTTDWQMLREGVTPFGPILSKQVQVKDTPVITQQPTDQSVYLTRAARFTVQAAGVGTLSYRWQKDQVDLNDGGHYADVTTATLAVLDVAAENAGRYRCVVSNANGSTISNEALLALLGPPPLLADLDGDLDVDLDDFAMIQRCLTGSAQPQTHPACAGTNLDGSSDHDVDDQDMMLLVGCLSGANVPGNPSCMP